MNGSPKLLFLSPAWPRRSGTGLSMRAWAVAEALGRCYNVFLVVPRPDGLPVPSELPTNVTAATDTTTVGLSARIRWRFRDRSSALYRSLRREPEEWPRAALLPREVATTEFDAVHVFRHYMAPYAVPFLGRVPCRLDLDESEVRTRLRIAQLFDENGLAGRARSLRAEACFLERQEERWIPAFDTVYVSSEADRQYLADRGLPVDAVVLPNTVPIPPSPAAPPAGGEPILLFVGNMNYYPNEDAVRFLAGEILPLLGEAGWAPRVQVAGYGPAKLRQAVAGRAGVEWLGFVEDLTPLYRNAHIVIAPIRAGGGTRIKILEAFSHCRAVVSTAVGAEGLEADDGRHLILGETARELATACIRLMKYPERRDKIAGAGYELAVRRYSPRRLDEIVK